MERYFGTSLFQHIKENLKKVANATRNITFNYCFNSHCGDMTLLMLPYANCDQKLR